MKNIFIIGAGYVARALIDYLLERSDKYEWQITVGDLDVSLAEEKVGNHPRGKAIEFNVKDEAQRESVISNSDVVISLLPAFMHNIPAATCLKFSKHLITASYIKPEIMAMDEEAKSKDLLFMGEMGLDPGIDHMVIMELIDKIKKEGGELTALRSFTGGLIAPESDTNPWKYKFTWAPRNVVLAGQGTAQYLKEGRFKFIPYKRLFSLYDEISVPNYGNFEAYANRDSLLYTSKYGAENVPTFIRGTLRKEGFCDAWHSLVTLGLTDDSFPIYGSEKLTYNELISSFLPDVGATNKEALKQRLSEFLNIPTDGAVMEKLEWLELFDDRKIERKDGTPAQILQDLLEEKWALQDDDKDLIVMTHIMDYKKDGKKYKLNSSLTYKGQNSKDTAMGRLVGIPLAIMTKLLLTDKIKIRGVRMPIYPEVYEPAIKELKEYGVEFHDLVEEIS